MISCAGLYAKCFLPSFAMLSIVLPFVKYGLFSFAGFTVLLDINVDFALSMDIMDLKLALVLVGLMLSLVRLLICLGEFVLPRIPERAFPCFLKVLTGLTVVINLTNLVFVFVGLPVLLAAIRDVRFDTFLIYEAVLVQYVSELEANFNKGQESPAHPD